MTPDTDEAADQRDRRDGDPAPRGSATSRRRFGWFATSAVLATLAVGATAWAMHASAQGPGTVLEVSDPQAPGPATGTVTPAAPAGTHLRVYPRTPAHVAHAAPSQVVSERPRMVTLASGTTMRVRVSATATSGELEIPTNINQAGWWDGGARLGDPYGAIVVAAHVDSFTQGLGRFAELLSVRSGDLVHLDSAHLSQSFQVVSAKLVPKTSVSASSDVYSARGASRLVLITCGGGYDPSLGGYQSNMVVVAVPDGRLVSRD